MMQVRFTLFLALLTVGCGSAEDPSANPPANNLDAPPSQPSEPDNPPPAAEPVVDPMIALRRLGAVMETDGHGDIRSITADGPQIVDQVLELIGGLDSLVMLNLAYSEITDAGLEHLAGLTRLETLILRGDEITDRGLVHLEGLSNLKKLDIEFAAVTDEGVARLQKALPNCDINY